MILTLTTTHAPSTDLGFLLHKHPSRTHHRDLSFGRAHVFFTEVGSHRCSAALLLEVDPIALARGRHGREPLAPYVNDRPYVASSFMSVAISECFGSALAGRSRDRPELAGRPIPLHARLSVVPCRGGRALLDRLFVPLGYEVTATSYALDDTHPSWGDSPHFDLELRTEKRLSELLAHLYVLIPVLDDDKHYWIGDDEVAKLLRHGEGWLSTHPHRELIVDRYLKHQHSLARRALDHFDPRREEATGSDDAPEAHSPRLAELRLEAVVATLLRTRSRRVIDLGCGHGELLRTLRRDPFFERIVGFDVSNRALEIAAERLHLDRLDGSRRVELLLGSLTYRDDRLAGYDAATLVEVIEHLDESRLSSLERVVFEHARPRVVLVTTPNAEYNVKLQGVSPGRMRHRDHRFEWTRAQFAEWVRRVADRFGYSARCESIGEADEALGSPTQMAVFES
ncbi:MAG: 3' terminal RNA ribose 2'-O-methyltransferase Hen1 [Deltaproteobacteria bacterium]|nr:3' terminal RNA ribose 2'-O-methyltransferase Hen1 [Deltaproteobacteria bacterium]